MCYGEGPEVGVGWVAALNSVRVRAGPVGKVRLEQDLEEVRKVAKELPEGEDAESRPASGFLTF